jgi:hypothetical protein
MGSLALEHFVRERTPEWCCELLRVQLPDEQTLEEL